MPVPFLAAIVAPLAIVAPAQQNEAGVRAFLQSVYAGYSKDGPGARLDEPERYFEPVLAAAIRKDADAAAAVGDMSKMDVDPFCSCQDFEAITPKIAVTGIAGKKAVAIVSFTSFGEKVELRYDLVWTAKGWRIFDIAYSDGRGSTRAVYFPSA